MVKDVDHRRPVLDRRQSITYNALHRHAGPSTGTNIQVSDTPTNLTITNVSGACGSLPCTISSLAVGANTTHHRHRHDYRSRRLRQQRHGQRRRARSDSGNNTDSTGNGGTAAASADVSIVKT